MQLGCTVLLIIVLAAVVPAEAGKKRKADDDDKFECPRCTRSLSDTDTWHHTPGGRSRTWCCPMHGPEAGPNGTACGCNGEEWLIAGTYHAESRAEQKAEQASGQAAAAMPPARQAKRQATRTSGQASSASSSASGQAGSSSATSSLLQVVERIEGIRAELLATISDVDNIIDKHFPLQPVQPVPLPPPTTPTRPIARKAVTHDGDLRAPPRIAGIHDGDLRAQPRTLGTTRDGDGRDPPRPIARQGSAGPLKRSTTGRARPDQDRPPLARMRQGHSLGGHVTSDCRGGRSQDYYRGDDDDYEREDSCSGLRLEPRAGSRLAPSNRRH